MIPEFTENGLLPAGLHRTTVDEIKNRFGRFNRSDRRVRLFERVEQLLADAKTSGIVRRVIFAGSFVSNVPDPNDFDCILVIDPTILGVSLRPREYNLVSRHSARRLYGGDVVPVLEGSDAHLEYLEFFQQTRDGGHVGVVEIEL